MPVTTSPERSAGKLSQGERTSLVRNAARRETMGLGKMTQEEVDLRFQSIVAQYTSGVTGEGAPRLKAIKTHVFPIPAAVWSHVRSGEKALLGELGGENVRVKVVQKEKNGLVTVSESLYEDVIPRDQRQVPYDTFVSRIAVPLAEYAAEVGAPHDPIKLGLSVGLPHETRVTNRGVEIHFHPTREGSLEAKEHVIVDWRDIKRGQREFTRAVGRRMQQEIPGLRIKTAAGGNDTAGVLLDAGAAQRAREAGYNVLDEGDVDGTGTNKAVLLKAGYNRFLKYTVPTADAGIVNTEVGHGRLPDNRVSERVREHLIAAGVMPKDQGPEVEHETGQYLPLRLAAGVELLAEDGVLQVENPYDLANKVIESSKIHKAFMDDIALGKLRLTLDSETNQMIQIMAQEVMERAAQVYGILHGIDDGNKEPEDFDLSKSDASLTEGSVLLKGKIDAKRTLRGEAQKVASRYRGRKTIIVPAEGLAGIAGLTMAHEHMRSAA